jgi:hypothetical protein
MTDSSFRGIPETYLPPGTPNFVVNPSGEQGCIAWTQLGQHSCKVETSGTPVSADITTNFVSSYKWCQMGQLVPLHQYINEVPSATIEVAANMARFDCRSMFGLEVIILDSNGRCLRQLTTVNFDAPMDCWEKSDT